MSLRLKKIEADLDDDFGMLILQDVVVETQLLAVFFAQRHHYIIAVTKHFELVVDGRVKLKPKYGWKRHDWQADADIFADKAYIEELPYYVIQEKDYPNTKTITDSQFITGALEELREKEISYRLDESSNNFLKVAGSIKN